MEMSGPSRAKFKDGAAERPMAALSITSSPPTKFGGGSKYRPTRALIGPWWTSLSTRKKAGGSRKSDDHEKVLRHGSSPACVRARRNSARGEGAGWNGADCGERSCSKRRLGEGDPGKQRGWNCTLARQGLGCCFGKG